MVNATEMILACRKVRDQKPTSIHTLAGVHGVHYGVEDGNHYADIGLVLPEGIFIYDEYTGDTANLNGIRIFLDGPHKFRL